MKAEKLVTRKNTGNARLAHKLYERDTTYAVVVIYPHATANPTTSGCH